MKKYRYWYRVVFYYRHPNETTEHKCILAMPPEYRKVGYGRYARICLRSYSKEYGRRRIFIRAVKVIKIKKGEE